MSIKRYLLITSLLAGSYALPALGSGPQVLVYGADPDAGPATAPLSTGTRISFDGGVQVVNGSDVRSFSWDNVGKIGFRLPGMGGVDIVTDDAVAIRLRQNPVEDMLVIDCGLDAPARLEVTSISGIRMLSIADWCGQSVDVASFVPGVYLLSVNNETIKFIKK